MIVSICSVLNTPARVLVESGANSLKVWLARGALDLSVVAKRKCLDLITNSTGEPPSPGLWVWEGCVFADDFVPRGRWRPCTDAEKESVEHGKALWAELPNGDSDDEMILVEDADKIREVGVSGNGFTPVGEELDELPCGHYDRRGDMEEDERFKQLIPYVVLEDDGLLFAYRRKSKGNEDRLHNKFSIGVGGHIDMMTPKTTLHSDIVGSAMRELHEEISFPSLDAWRSIVDDKHLTYQGMINDDSNPVGRVHVGLLFTANVDAFVDGLPVIGVRETDKMEGRWMTRKEVESRLDEFETWSQIAFKALEDMRV